MKTFVLLGATALLLCATWARADSMFGGSSVSAGSPFGGGTNKYCLFNDNGTFGQDSGCQYDKAVDTLTIGGGITLSAGQLLVPDGTYTAPSIAFASSPSAGLFRGTTNAVPMIAASGAPVMRFATPHVWIRSDAKLVWSNSANLDSVDGPDLLIYKDAPNILAQSNGTSAQTYRLYNTFTDASNYERASLGWAANVLTLGTENAGTGAARALQFSIGGAAKWQIATTFHLLAVTDNSYDIGASGANRPRTIYAGTSVDAPAFSIAGTTQKFPKTFTATYDPASLAAQTARCDNVTVTGITTTGGAVTANIGAVDPATGCVMSSVRASAADTVRVCWMNTIDATTACDTASSTWTFTQAQ